MSTYLFVKCYTCQAVYICNCFFVILKYALNALNFNLSEFLRNCVAYMFI